LNGLKIGTELFMFKKLYLALIYICLQSAFVANAQKTGYFDEPVYTYKRAIELFDKEKYGAARSLFEQVLFQNPDENIKAQGNYYIALCATHQFGNDAIGLLQSFSRNFRTHSKYDESTYYIAHIYFRDKQYKEALKAFSAVNAEELEDNFKYLYYFEKGFSEYKLNKYDDARKSLAKIIDDESGLKYSDANYYLGYIYYIQGNDREVLKLLKNTMDIEPYNKVVPLYLCQISYRSKEYAACIKWNSDKAGKEILADIYMFKGLSHYELKEFEQAAEMLENRSKSKELTDSELYILGYCHIQNKDYSQAIFRLTHIADHNNLLYQQSQYTLANCFVLLNKKENARAAYYNAGKYEHDKSIKEDAQFNFAKLSAEILPTQVASITSLQNFINTYPDSKYGDDAKNILSSLLLNTKQYAKALVILDGIKVKNAQIELAIQKCAFCRAEELYKANDIVAATKLFEKSYSYNNDMKFKSLSVFWLGEIAYIKEEYGKAIDLYKEFEAYPQAVKTFHYTSAYYNLGYSYLKLDKYQQSNVWLEKFIAAETYFGNKGEMVLDAHARLADNYFLQKEYGKATNEYNYVINKNSVDADYALFQMGIIYGLQNKLYEKINILSKLIEKYENSDLYEKALYELGYTYFNLEKYDQAVESFNDLIESQKSPVGLVRRAQLNIGLIFYNQKQNNKAIEQFQYIVKKYSESEEAHEGLEILKTIYTENGEFDKFDEWAKANGIKIYQSNTAEKDTLMFESAMNMIDRRDSIRGLEVLGKYIIEFPDGAYILKSHQLKADILNRKNRKEEALPEYEWIATRQPNEFTERSLKWVCNYYYNIKNYAKALEYFEKLEPNSSVKENKILSFVGQMRCTDILGETGKLKIVAEKIVEYPGIEKEYVTEAKYHLGKIYYSSDKIAALNYFKDVVKLSKTTRGAESKYYIALIYFENIDTINCKKAVFELSEHFSDYEYWVAKGYLVLADHYIRQNDDYQAKYTLQSLIDNYEKSGSDSDDIIKMAQEKLDLLTHKDKNREELIKQQKLNDSKSQEEKDKENKEVEDF